MFLKGTPAFMSIKALSIQGHVHCLEDDLESFIYVVLYAALRWLPVESEGDLYWWMTDFFSAPNHNRRGGGASDKLMNATYRIHSLSLKSTKSSHVVDWLNAAMDLHYKGGAANRLWKGGAALREMWKKVLARDLPSNDRCVNPVRDMRIREDYSLHATYTQATSHQDLYRTRDESPPPPAPAAPTKRSRARSAPHPTPQPSKRSRTGTGHKRGQ